MVIHRAFYLSDTRFFYGHSVRSLYIVHASNSIVNDSLLIFMRCVCFWTLYEVICTLPSVRASAAKNRPWPEGQCWYYHPNLSSGLLCQNYAARPWSRAFYWYWSWPSSRATNIDIGAKRLWSGWELVFLIQTVKEHSSLPDIPIHCFPCLVGQYMKVLFHQHWIANLWHQYPRSIQTTVDR